ncbi:MAG: hypothetical protein HY719_11865 [Planctomycetes bacterium]|nr:hypothetical protein [Planctomycetota bacterium]
MRKVVLGVAMLATAFASGAAGAAFLAQGKPRVDDGDRVDAVAKAQKETTTRAALARGGDDDLARPARVAEEQLRDDLSRYAGLEELRQAASRTFSDEEMAAIKGDVEKKLGVMEAGVRAEVQNAKSAAVQKSAKIDIEEEIKAIRAKEEEQRLQEARKGAEQAGKQVFDGITSFFGFKDEEKAALGQRLEKAVGRLDPTRNPDLLRRAQNGELTPEEEAAARAEFEGAAGEVVKSFQEAITPEKQENARKSVQTEVEKALGPNAPQIPAPQDMGKAMDEMGKTAQSLQENLQQEMDKQRKSLGDMKKGDRDF